MKKNLLLIVALVLSVAVLAQGNSGNKGKGRQKDKDKSEQTGKNKDKEDKEKKEKEEHEKKIWEGTNAKDGDGPKPSKNQPAKVRSSFQRDYPNASGVSWSKYRGDWTATFKNGLWMSTAVYHANGERRDTRTLVRKDDIPRRILDSIFKKRPNTRVEDAVKIETRSIIMKEIFRIKDIIQGKSEYFYYDGNGVAVKYDY